MTPHAVMVELGTNAIGSSGGIPPVPMSPDDKVEFRLERTSGQPGDMHGERRWPGEVRRLGRARLERWGLEALSDTAVLLMSELATNAIVHTKDTPIRVRLSRTASGSRAEVCIEVFSGSTANVQLRTPDINEESGRGLALVEACSDRWGVGPNSVWFSLCLPKSEGGA